MISRPVKANSNIKVVTGPVFAGQQLQSVGPDGVLVPSATWKAVYAKRRHRRLRVLEHQKAALRYHLRCDVDRHGGRRPFPALPSHMKATAIALPIAEAGRQGWRKQNPRPHQTESLSEPVVT